MESTINESEEVYVLVKILDMLCHTWLRRRGKITWVGFFILWGVSEFIIGLGGNRGSGDGGGGFLGDGNNLKSKKNFQKTEQKS